MKILIVLDGIHACGKSTLADKLADYYKEKGFEVILSSWNSHEIIRPMITKLRRSHQFKDPTVYSLSHLTEFAFRYEQDIIPNLQKGRIVILDRYVMTGIVRDKLRGIKSNYSKSLYSFAIPADFTFILDISAEESISRRLIEKNVYWQFGMNNDYNYNDPIEVNAYKQYLDEMRKEYLKLCKEQENCYVINGTKTQSQLLEYCVHKINERLDMDSR